MSKKKSKPPSKYAGMSRTERARIIGSLGGKARAAKLSAVERSRISAKGGMVTFLRYGSEHYAALGKAVWDGMDAKQQAAKTKSLANGRKLGANKSDRSDA